MAQSFNLQGKPALGKDTITKFGPVAGAVVSLFGFFLFFVGLIFDWVKVEGFKLSGFKVLFDNDAAGIRGGFLNGFLCNLPFFLCGSVLVALFIIVGTFYKKLPSINKQAGPIALGVLTLLSCCPGLLFFADMLNRESAKYLGFGYFISLFGLAVTFLGGLVAIGVSFYADGFPKARRRP